MAGAGTTKEEAASKQQTISATNNRITGRPVWTRIVPRAPGTACIITAASRCNEGERCSLHKSRQKVQRGSKPSHRTQFRRNLRRQHDNSSPAGDEFWEG